MRFVALAALVTSLLLGTAVGAVRVACPDAVYRVEQGLPGVALDGFNLTAGRLHVRSACPWKAARMVAGRAGPELRLRLRPCERDGSGGLRLRARVSDDCATVTASVRRGRPGAPSSAVTARRVGGCGNGVVERERGEQCDRTLCGDGLVCVDCACMPFQTTTTLSSTTTTSVTLLPTPVCGDGVREGHETCDGEDMGGVTCEDRGHPQGGVLRCQESPGCRFFDTSGCFSCGNGRREGAEACDVNDLGGAVCDEPGETGGEVDCNDDCTLSRRTCWRCGNARLDPGERCDDGNAMSGDGCSATCHDECGDGVLNRTEGCDDGNEAHRDGCSGYCFGEKHYPGGGGEPGDACDLVWDVSAAMSQPYVQPAVTEGDEELLVECPDGDASCDRDDAAGVCEVALWACMESLTVRVDENGPLCSARRIVRLDVLGETTAPVPWILDAFEAAWRRIPVDDLIRDETSLIPGATVYSYAPCASLPVTVPAGESRTIAVGVTNAEDRYDTDVVTVACRAWQP